MFAASCRYLCISLLASLLMNAGAVAGRSTLPSLTVLVDFESPHSETSLQSLRTSLNHLLSPGGFAVDVQIESELPRNAEFGELVVFKMKGSCSIAPEVAEPIYDERGPLAKAFTSDGQVLHFGEVECDRVRHSLQRILGTDTSAKNQKAYGSALAVVIAHEVYHMLGNVKVHTRQGLTKPALSASELTDSHLEMPATAIASIESNLNPSAENKLSSVH